ncbi:MAG: FAD-binding oxidoreductase [Candidatus Dormibacteraceae bacterium]
MAPEGLANRGGERLPDESVRAFAAAFGGGLVAPGDTSYEEARRLFNGGIDRRPGLICRPRDLEDVRRAVTFAAEHDVLLAVRGGGHNVAGNASCDGGLVIDFATMREVVVDPVRRTATAGPGTVWRDLDGATQEHGLATTGGLISHTGVAGFTLGGGVGWLLRKHGLACDNLTGAQVVAADGRVIEAGAGGDEELLWGLRGGGGNFGAVTSLRFQLHPLGQVYGGMAGHPLPRLGEMLRFFRDFVATAPDELTCLAVQGPAPDGSGHQVGVVAGCYAGDLAAGELAMQPVADFGPPAMTHLGPAPYAGFQRALDEGAPPGHAHYWKSHLLGELSDGAIDAVADHARTKTSPLSQVHIHHLGGAMARVAPEATAFPHRSARFIVNVIGEWEAPGDADRHVAWVRSLWSALEPHSLGASWVNFLADEGGDPVRAAYGPNHGRLVALKDRYDPENLFRLNQNIRPSGPVRV